MAKRFVRISLGTKFRFLFAAAVVAIIGAALGVPWYFTEKLVDEASKQSADQITELGLAEWELSHAIKPRPRSAVARYFTSGGAGRRGPNVLVLVGEKPATLDATALEAVGAFEAHPRRKMVVLSEENEEGERVIRCFRAARARASCAGCHPGMSGRSFRPAELVGLVDITLPPAPGSLIWWSWQSWLEEWADERTRETRAWGRAVSRRICRDCKDDFAAIEPGRLRPSGSARGS